MNMAQAVAVLGEYASDQWGLVTTAQAAAAGINTTTLARLTAAGSITPVLRGVYQLAGAQHAEFMTEAAAWLRLDPATPAWQRESLSSDGGVLSYRSAALIHQIGDLRASQVEISAPRRRRTRDHSVRFHLAHLGSVDVVTVEGLPVTSVERTLADLFAEHLDGGHAVDLLTDAFNRYQIKRERLADLLAPAASRYGAPENDGHALIDLLTRQRIDPQQVSASLDVAAVLQQWEELSSHIQEAEAIAVKLRTLQARYGRKTAA